MDTIELRVPPAFINDCLDSGCDVGDYVKRTKTLTATAEQIAELRWRAEHYATGGLDMAPKGLILSAKATLRALDRAEAYYAEVVEYAEENLWIDRERLSILTWSKRT